MIRVETEGIGRAWEHEATKKEGKEERTRLMRMMSVYGVSTSD